MAEFKELCGGLIRDLATSDVENTSESYQRLANALSRAQIQCREYIQRITRDDIAKVVKKIEKKQKLDAEEVRFLKLWIVGDADSYAKIENNFKDWKQELKRIKAELAHLEDRESSFEEVSRLRAVLTDATRVAHDIAFFLDMKERVVKFEDATAVLDDAERVLLVRWLEKKLTSPDF